MATFPSIEASYGIQKSNTANFKTAKFGDGYEQRLTFGINQNPKSWNLVWNNISESESDTIETFLNARLTDAASFTWTPPDESTAYKWVCEEWQKKIDVPNRATINATFRQVFEP